MSRKITKPAHSNSKSSSKRSRIAKAKTGLTGTRAEKWYGSKWIRPEKRRAIYNRDANKCVYCGKSHDLTLDHVVSAEAGGTNDVSNLVTACRSCNSRKGTLDLRTFARMIAAEIGSKTRTVTDRVRKHLKAAINVAAAKEQLVVEREVRDERAAIESLNGMRETAYLSDAFEFDFAA